MMTHYEKVERFQQLLRERGYWVSNAIPPAWHALWRLGFQTPPPYFLPFPVAVACAGVPFAILWGLCMRWLVWPGPDYSLAMAIWAAVATGAGFGLAMAALWRYQAKKLGLTSWAEFSGLNRTDTA